MQEPQVYAKYAQVGRHHSECQAVIRGTGVRPMQRTTRFVKQ